MKVEYMGGPWDGRIQVGASFTEAIYLFRKTPAITTVKQICSTLPEPRHLYVLKKNGGRYVYLYKGES